LALVVPEGIPAHGRGQEQCPQDSTDERLWRGVAFFIGRHYERGGRSVETGGTGNGGAGGYPREGGGGQRCLIQPWLAVPSPPGNGGYPGWQV